MILALVLLALAATVLWAAWLGRRLESARLELEELQRGDR